jgi:hypothetical protein
VTRSNKPAEMTLMPVSRAHQVLAVKFWDRTRVPNHNPVISSPALKSHQTEIHPHQNFLSERGSEELLLDRLHFLSSPLLFPLQSTFPLPKTTKSHSKRIKRTSIQYQLRRESCRRLSLSCERPLRARSI